jgi:hypothetical protein
MKLIRNEDREGYIFSFSIKNGEEHVGDIIVAFRNNRKMALQMAN